jgi:arginine decarboxylase
VPTAYAAMTSEVPGEVIAAAVGWALPDNPARNGVIMEYHDKATREEVERMVVHMLREAFRARGWTIGEMKVESVEHRVERTGCALAAVALLSDDDLA